MDYLRRKHDDDPFYGDDFEPELDPGLVHRLTAYTRGAWARNRSAELADPVEAESADPALELADEPESLLVPRFTFSSDEDPVDAVDESRAALSAAAAEDEPYEPEADSFASGSYEPAVEPSGLETETSSGEEELDAEVVPEPTDDPFGEGWARAVGESPQAELPDTVDDEVVLPGVWSAGAEDVVLPEPELVSPGAEDVQVSGAEVSGEAPRFGAVPEFTYADDQVWGRDDVETVDEDDLPVPGVWAESRAEEDFVTADSVQPEPGEPEQENEPVYTVAEDQGAAPDVEYAPPPATMVAVDGVDPIPEAVDSDRLESQHAEARDAESDDLAVELEQVEAADDAEPVLLEEPTAEPVVDEGAQLDEVSTLEPGAIRRRSFRRGRSKRPAKERERSSKHKGAKRLVGLKIGASQVAAAQVVNNGAPELVEVVREPLEAGVVVSGEIRDPEALAAALKRLFELHKLPKRGVRLGLSNNRIGVRVFEIEGVDDDQQLDNAIRFRAEEVLPIPLDEAVLDYVVLEEEVREDGTPWKRILLVVAYREVVDRYLHACRGAGLEIVGIDLEAFALLRSVEAPMDRGVHAGALVAVAIGHDRSTIAVSTGRFCEFTRVLDWGGWSLNVAIARELDKAPSEVEAYKRQLSFSGATEVDGLSPEQAAKAREAIQRSLAAFVRELIASLQFYQAQPGALGIGEVVLTGGTAHMDGLPEALGELVGVPIRLGDPFKRVKVGPKVSHEGARGSLSVAIGLGIED